MDAYFLALTKPNWEVSCRVLEMERSWRWCWWRVSSCASSLTASIHQSLDGELCSQLNMLNMLNVRSWTVEHNWLPYKYPFLPGYLISSQYTFKVDGLVLRTAWHNQSCWPSHSHVVTDWPYSPRKGTTTSGWCSCLCALQCALVLFYKRTTWRTTSLS